MNVLVLSRGSSSAHDTVHVVQGARERRAVIALSALLTRSATCQKIGLDFARGPEENAIYVQLGNAWVRP